MNMPQTTIKKAARAAQNRPQMSGAEMVWAALREHQTDLVFGYPGGSILPVYDLLRKETMLRHILPRHEQAGVFAALGYAKASGRTGVVIVTSGPGATNTITGIADAYADSLPLVVICGQVPTGMIGTKAFQESDMIGITRSCTKANWLVRNCADLPSILHEAFYLASTGRKGPVLIDLPKDVQLAMGPYISALEWSGSFAAQCPSFSGIDSTTIEQIVALMKDAHKPILYTGGGVASGGMLAAQALRDLATETGFPVTSTLMGLGAFPASAQQWLGMLGMYGTLEANKAMHEADLIVAIGVRFDDRATANLAQFAPNAKIVHIDIDPRDIGAGRNKTLSLQAESGLAMQALCAAWRNDSRTQKNLGRWWENIDLWRKQACLSFQREKGVIKPQQVIQALAALTQGQDVYIATGVGQHQMWTAQHYGFEAPNRLITSGGHGSMGYCLPAAIGTQLAKPDTLVVCVTGDGSIQMNSQEMATAAAYGLPIKVLLLNNQRLGMVRQIMGDDYGQPLEETLIDSQPDFVKLAKAYGWKAHRVTHPARLDRSVKALLESKGPALLDCRTAPEEKCYPVIPTGHGHGSVRHNGQTTQQTPRFL